MGANIIPRERKINDFSDKDFIVKLTLAYAEGYGILLGHAQ